MNSFVPATIKLWNSLPEDTVNSSSIASFKNKLKNPRIHPNIKLYNYGKRKTNIIHCQLRNQASNLNAHLHNHFLISNPSCDLCANPYEDSYHFFLECPYYNIQRRSLVNYLNSLIGMPVAIEILLCGVNGGTLSTNTKIFDAVHTYIEKKTKRFNT